MFVYFVFTLHFGFGSGSLSCNFESSGSVRYGETVNGSDSVRVRVRIE